MNKHTELSDFEINKRIAELDTKNKYSYFEREQAVFRDFSNGASERYDPCNNPADAMPIIIENKIGVNFVNDDIGWAAHDSKTDHGELEVYGKNYYRTAMICFLLMRDAENEG